MSRTPLIGAFSLATEHIDSAVGYLHRLRNIYSTSSVPEKRARIAALDAKIDALRAIQLNPAAAPWDEDEL